MTHTPLIVMAKPPALGRAKTRLAADIGDKDALAVYEMLLDHTLSQGAASQLPMTIHWAFPDASTSRWSFHNSCQQTDAGLGERMAHAFAKHSDEAKVMIGTDCPALDADLLNEAAETLKEYDVVFGPAEDGGYYLIGITGEKDALLKNVSWSTDAVLNQSIQICKDNNWSYRLLNELRDIDTFADLKAEGFAVEIASRHTIKN